MRNGDIRKATSCFVTALERLKKTSLMAESKADRNTLVPISVHWSVPLPQKVFLTQSYVYSRALQIVSRIDERKFKSSSHPNKNISPNRRIWKNVTIREYKTAAWEITVAVLFNLALLLHMKGCNTNKSELLRRSLRAYEVVLGMLRKNSPTLRSVRTCLSLALVNNIGLVYAEFHAYEQAERYFEQIDPLLDRVDVEQTTACCIMDESEHDGFAMNSLWEQPRLAAAA